MIVSKVELTDLSHPFVRSAPNFGLQILKSTRLITSSEKSCPYNAGEYMMEFTPVAQEYRD